MIWRSSRGRFAGGPSSKDDFSGALREQGEWGASPCPREKNEHGFSKLNMPIAILSLDVVIHGGRLLTPARGRTLERH